MPSTLSRRKQIALKASVLTIMGTLLAAQTSGAPQKSMEFASLGSPTKTLSTGSSLSAQSRSIEIGEIKLSEKDIKKEIEVIMQDPAMSQKWDLQLTDAMKAWKISRGSKNIIVAVIDTGIDLKHEDLKGNLWINPGETGKDALGRDKATNGIDDDGNGFVDDVHGWNFVGNNHDLKDQHGHGSHIAGIIGAEGGNGKGISGVAPKVSLMTLKYYDPKSSGMDNLMNTVKAIRYATKMGAHIINYSGGGLEPSEPEKLALAEAGKKGILVVAAAGNERSNTDLQPYYPADYPMSHIISVTAIDRSKKVLPSSNFGKKVHIAAPGNEILSTLHNNRYGTMTGTSQATAFVTGVAALLMAHNSELRQPERLIKYLTLTGDTDENLIGKTRYTKRLNSYRALAIKDSGETLNGIQTGAASPPLNSQFEQSQELSEASKNILAHIRTQDSDALDSVRRPSRK